ncbi:MAG: heparinase II/III family protein [Armatimonadota bacterium]
MNKVFASLIAIISLNTSLGVEGTTLEDLLNYPVVDQKCPETIIMEEGMGLVKQGVAKFIPLSKEFPLGQTFRVGINANILWRICVGICHWPDSWQEGEEVTLTLYDSPQKRTRLYSRTIDFDHKWFKWDVVFDIYIPTKPETEYYFELTHNGGADNSVNVAYIPQDAYPRGTAFIGTQKREDIDLYFVVLTKPQRLPEANLDRFFERLDMSRPELAQVKQALSRGDRKGACTAILDWFNDYMKSADWVWRWDPKTKYDTSRMDQVCDSGRLYRNDEEHKDQWITMGTETTWREVWPGTSEYVRMNDLFADLGRAYAATRNEKYAQKLNELMADYIQDNPSPFEGGMRGGRWVAMFQAWRLGDAWDGVANAIDSRCLTDDVKLAWLDYWARMADFAMREPSGGNHANAVAEALMKFASRFPIYKDSRKWFEFGWQKLVSNSLSLFRDDGGCVEPAMNYHGFSLANLQAGIDTAKSFGIAPPPELLVKLEKALAYTAYMLKPDGQIPSYGDTDCADFRPGVRKWDGWRKGEAMDGARMFNRSDLLYIATAGKQGTRPQQNSYCFPDTGHYILRSDWGGDRGQGFEDARYLFFRAGKFGSHGHDDLNNITLYAYGRPLIIDPGRTTYGTPLMYELSKNRSHNVLLVDEMDMNHSEPSTKLWCTNAVADMVENAYYELYPGVEHRRAVVFIRPDYYVLFDRADSREPHQYGINFWLTPPEITIDHQKSIVHTNEPKGSNILLQAVARDGLYITKRNGVLDLAGERRSDIPVVTFYKDGVSRAEFVTLLYPFRAKVDSDSVKVREFAVNGGHGIAINTPERSDVVVYCWDGGSAKLPRDTFTFEGKACVAHIDNMDFTVVDCTLLHIRGQKLVESQRPVKDLCVEYKPNYVLVTCSVAEPSLKVASLGRKYAVVNGKEIPIKWSFFEPFSTNFDHSR